MTSGFTLHKILLMPPYVSEKDIFLIFEGIFMSCKKILMIFSLSHALLPKPLLCLAKRSGYPGSWRGTNSRFGRAPKRFNAFGRKSNDFLAKIFFLTLAFMSSQDRNDQWLINHNGRRYLGCTLGTKQQKQPP